MRMILMFDMPTDTAEERKAYRKFRKFLLRLKANNPKKGNITILTVTEKQFARMIYLYGDKNTSIANSEERLVFLGDNYCDED